LPACRPGHRRPCGEWLKRVAAPPPPPAPPGSDLSENVDALLDALVDGYNQDYVRNLANGIQFSTLDVTRFILKWVSEYSTTPRDQVAFLAYLLARAIEKLPGTDRATDSRQKRHV
jgi:hypothetical protein